MKNNRYRKRGRNGPHSDQSKRPRSKQRRATSPLPPINVTLTIAELGRHGHGVGRIETRGGHEGQTQSHSGSERCFVPFALPGEVVRVLRIGDEVSLLDIIEPSPDRVTPFCAIYTRCGGCVMQHLAETPYHNWKRNIVVTALENKGLSVTVAPLIDAHGKGRRRISLHVRATKNSWKIGFMTAGTHQILDLESCPIVVQDLADVTPLARALADALGETARRSGRDLGMSFTETAEGLDCHISGIQATGYEMFADLADCAEHYDLARVSLAGEIVVERRKPWLAMGTAHVTPPPGGFLQATTAGEEIIARLVDQYVGQAVGSLADLFSGVGPFALRLAHRMPVYAADNNITAIAALDDARRFTTGLKPVRTEVRNLFKNPLNAFELGAFDVVIVNPPRAGAEAQSRELAGSSVGRVIMVSCDPASFARDAAILCNAGYTLDNVVPVDQFKWSAHVEVVGLFNRVVAG